MQLTKILELPPSERISWACSLKHFEILLHFVVLSMRDDWQNFKMFYSLLHTRKPYSSRSTSDYIFLLIISPNSTNSTNSSQVRRSNVVPPLAPSFTILEPSVTFFSIEQIVYHDRSFLQSLSRLSVIWNLRRSS